MTKILLVEDDKSLREIYGVRLLAEGYDIVSAGDGEEALAMAVSEHPDLIVSDVMMPRVSGFDMLDILRANPSTRDIKVIMMTALSSEDQRKRGEMLGADRYLVKSQVGIEDVVKTVHEVLGDAHLTTEERLNYKQESQSEQISSAQQSIQSSQSVYQIPTQPAPAQQSVQQPVVSPQQPVYSMSAPRQMPVAERGVISQPSRPMPQVFDVQRSQPVLNSQPASPRPQQVPVQPAQPIQPQNPTVQVVTPQPSSLPQPTAPFSTDRPLATGERVIQPVAQSMDSVAREEQFAADLESVLNGVSSQNNTPFGPQ